MISTAERFALETQMAQALVNKASALDELDRKQEATQVYDEVIVRFGANQEATMSEIVAKALLLKGNSLAEMNENQEAITAYDHLVKRFTERAEPSLLKRVAMAFLNKGVVLGKLERREEALDAFQEVVNRFRAIDEAFPEVLHALLNISGTLIYLRRYDEAVEAVDDLFKACTPRNVFGSDPGWYLVNALMNKSIALLGLDRLQDTIGFCDDVVKEFEHSPYCEQVAKVLVNKGVALARLGRTEEQLNTYQEVLERFGGSDDPAVRHQVAIATNEISRLQATEPDHGSGQS